MTHPLLQFISKLGESAKEHIQLIKVASDDTAPAALALLSTIIEQTEACVILLNNKHFAGVEIIQRSTLEAYVHFANLVNDPGYVEVMAAEFNYQLIRLLKEGAKGTNVYLAGLDKNEPAAQALKEAEADLARLEAKGVNRISIFDAFDRAKMADVYRSAYNSLCAEGHNDLRALRRRHLTRDGDQLHLHLYTQATHEDYIRVLDGMAGILNNANLLMHQRYNTPALAKFEEFDKELSAVRAAL